MASLKGVALGSDGGSTSDYPDFYLDGCAYRDRTCQPASEVIGFGEGNGTGEATHGTNFILR